jgi:hypothetical protein
MYVGGIKYLMDEMIQSETFSAAKVCLSKSHAGKVDLIVEQTLVL